jgi:hypothetical protein
MYIQWFWLTNGGNQKKHFQLMMATKKRLNGNQRHFGNDKKNCQLLGLVNFVQFGNQFFLIAWFGHQIVLGNDQKKFISKLMVEIEPSLMEQLNFFEQLKKL